MRNTIRNKISSGFTQIPNELVFDNSMSDRARFLMVYMLCKPTDWEFYNHNLSKDMGYSIDTLRKYLSELQNRLWLTKIERQGVDGKFINNEYILHFPSENLPCRKNANTVKNRCGKTITHTNKEYYKKRNNKNKYSLKRDSKFQINANPRKL